MALFGFGQSADITIKLDDEETRKTAKIRGEDGQQETHYLFYDGETIAGTVNVALKKANQKLEHQGIRIEFIGQIEVYYDRGNQQDFISLTKDLARPGELTQNSSFHFEFHNVEKPYESYMGINVKLRYFLRVTIVRRITDITREMDLIVHTLSSYPDADVNLKMDFTAPFTPFVHRRVSQFISLESALAVKQIAKRSENPRTSVGIEDCLHIEFEYNKSRYHLQDVIVGKIYFVLVRIKIKHMEITIIKSETVGSGPNAAKETDPVAKFEIMDGAPVRGESIPIRLFLAGHDLAPTMRDVSKKFSVRYLLNLVLVDEEDRRYFKQQEVTLWRKADKPVRTMLEPATTETNANGIEDTVRVHSGGDQENDRGGAEDEQ